MPEEKEGKYQVKEDEKEEEEKEEKEGEISGEGGRWKDGGE